MFPDDFDPNTATPEQINEKMREEMRYMEATLVMMRITAALQDASKDPKDRFKDVVEEIIKYGDQRVMDNMLG